MKNILKNFLIMFICFVASTPIISFYAGCKPADGRNWNIWYDNVDYRVISSEDGDYFAAGKIKEYNESGQPIAVQFIAAEVDGLPVRELGYTLLMNSMGESHYSTTLERLYAPGSIVDIKYNYIRTNNKGEMQFFYCGEAINLYPKVNGLQKDYTINLYVPDKTYSQFVALFPEEKYGKITLERANISYKLNTFDLPEYYYVDYVLYGERIINIPPEPTRSGYKFGGWFLEPECINRWSFESVLPEPSEGEDYKELSLYAMWIQ